MREVCDYTPPPPAPRLISLRGGALKELLRLVPACGEGVARIVRTVELRTKHRCL